MKIIHTILLMVFLTPIIFTVSCKQLFTTSVGTPFERDSLSIASSATVSSLADLAHSDIADDPEGAKALLDALAEKEKGDLTRLPIEDKTAILDLATTATLKIATVLELLNGFTSGTSNTNTLMADIFNAFDSNVNLGAIETLLGDPNTLNEAPVDSILLATVVLVADLIADRGAEAIMNILAGGTVPLDFSAAETARIDLITNITNVLDIRSSESSATTGGFNLLDLLGGTQS